MRVYVDWLKQEGHDVDRSRQYYGESEINVYMLFKRVIEHGGLDSVSLPNPNPSCAC